MYYVYSHVRVQCRPTAGYAKDLVWEVQLVWKVLATGVGSPCNWCGKSSQLVWEVLAIGVGSPCNWCGKSLQLVWKVLAIGVGSPRNWCGKSLQLVWKVLAIGVGSPRNWCGKSLQLVWKVLAVGVGSPCNWLRKLTPLYCDSTPACCVLFWFCYQTLYCLKFWVVAKLAQGTWALTLHA